jgi:NAD(P)-dependent dehydrogenase (short-subunit alcohol dehydrogenase family)
MPRLSERAALVTGGGTGIGRAVALSLAEEGAAVCVCGRRPGPLKAVRQAIETLGGVCLDIPTDVSDEDQVKGLVLTAQDALGPIDILVNNAGIGGGAPIHEHPVEEWDRVLGVNLRGPFLLSRAVLPGMRERGRGHIINISSESGLEHYQGDGAYGVGKHALNELGEYIQRENQDFGIRVDTVCPGMVVTEMTEDSVGLDHAKCLYPEDIADLVIWLVTRRPNIKIGNPILIQTMLNPWE